MLYFILLLLPLVTWAAETNLSSDLPMEFDGNTNSLVARQNATFIHNDLTLTADEIRYSQNDRIATATGNARINFKASRLVAKQITYNSTDESFTADNFRLGYYPFMIEGKSLHGTKSKIVIKNAVLKSSQTGELTPAISMGRMTLNPSDSHTRALITRAFLKLGPVPVLPIPVAYLSIPRNARPMVALDAGLSGTDGAYLRTSTLWPIASGIKAGANLDYYAKRGWLYGPRLEWKAGNFLTQLSSGYISDHGDRSTDVRGVAIGKERGFIESRTQAKLGDLQVKAQVQYWSDSEVVRDFRPDEYRLAPSPDNFAEAVLPFHGTYISAFGRMDPNNFDDVTQRVPEIRLDKLSAPIGHTGFYYSWLNSATRLEENNRSLDRLDSLLTIRRPISVTPWWQVTPLASGRATAYSDTATSNDSFTRTIGEVGVDSTWTFSSVWETQNATWKINGLRHLVQPTLQYRYTPNGDQYAERILAFDRDNFGSTIMAPMEFNEMTHIDQLTDRQLLRVGLKQALQTRQSTGFPSRDLLTFDVYQDINLSTPGTLKTVGDFYVLAAAHPASWISMGDTMRLNWQDLTLQENNLWVAVRDADLWTVTFTQRFRNNDTNQTGVRGTYRLTDTWSIIGDATYDAHLEKVSDLYLGLAQRLRSGWEVFYGFNRRVADERASKEQFTIRVKWLEF